MNNLTQLLNTDIIAVEVPRDAKMYISVMNYLCDENNDSEYDGFQLEDKYELLGEATEDEISFDVEPYVDFENDFGLKWFRDYTFDYAYCFDRKTANESFRSLLQASGLYWVNDIEKPNLNDFKSKPFCESGLCKTYEDLLKEWQEAESKLIKGKLIFLKIIK